MPAKDLVFKLLKYSILLLLLSILKSKQYRTLTLLLLVLISNSNTLSRFLCSIGVSTLFSTIITTTVLLLSSEIY